MVTEYYDSVNMCESRDVSGHYIRSTILSVRTPGTIKIDSKRQVRLDSYSYCKIKEAGMLTRKPRKQAVIDTFRHKTYQLR